MTKPRDRRYGSARWRKLREQVIARDGRVCAAPDCTSDMSAPRMTQVDHIIEVKDGGDFWDPNNCRVVCKYHHYSKTVEQIGQRQSGRGSVAARRELTPGDPRYCWRQSSDGLWHHFNPIHNIGDCQWPDCPHNEPVEP